MLSRSEKEAIVNELKNDIGNANAIFLTNLIGIKSNESVEVRKTVRDAKGKLIVTRNSLFERAAKGTSCESLLSGLKGPSAVAFAFNDAAAVAKCLFDAGKSLELVDLKAGMLDGKLLSSAQLKELAQLPSKDQMIATLLATFNAPIAALARVLVAINEAKENNGAPVVA